MGTRQYPTKGPQIEAAWCSDAEHRPERVTQLMPPVGQAWREVKQRQPLLVGFRVASRIWSKHFCSDWTPAETYFQLRMPRNRSLGWYPIQ